MRRQLTILAVVACLPVSAAMALRPLPSDPNGIAGFSGTTDFFGTNGTDSLNVSVDYAVFAPGQWTTAGGAWQQILNDVTFSNFAVGDVANEYVYAYQVTNNATAVGGNAASTTVLSQLNIGFSQNFAATSLGKDDAFDADHDVTVDSGGILQQLARFNFFFTGPALDVGQHSTILLMTSPNAPTFQQGSVKDSGIGSMTGTLPSPVPAPGAAVLAMIGVGLVGRLRRRA